MGGGGASGIVIGASWAGGIVAAGAAGAGAAVGAASTIAVALAVKPSSGTVKARES